MFCHHVIVVCDVSLFNNVSFCNTKTVVNEKRMGRSKLFDKMECIPFLLLSTATCS